MAVARSPRQTTPCSWRQQALSEGRLKCEVNRHAPLVCVGMPAYASMSQEFTGCQPHFDAFLGVDDSLLE